MVPAGLVMQKSPRNASRGIKNKAYPFNIHIQNLHSKCIWQMNLNKNRIVSSFIQTILSASELFPKLAAMPDQNARNQQKHVSTS